MTRIQLKKVNIYYESYDNGIPLIFIHGWSMSHRFWRKQIEHFQKKYCVIVFDLRGHGDSEKPEGAHTMEAFAADLHELIQRLRLKKVHLAGWSLGASVIFQYLASYSDEHIASISIVGGNAKIVAADGYQSGTPRQRFYEILSQLKTNSNVFREQFINAMFRNKLSEGEIDDMKYEIWKTPADIAYQSLADLGGRDFRKVLGSIRKPTLILHGRHDSLNRFDAAEFLLQHILDARLIAFEDSGHCPHLEEPEKFNAALEQFLGEISVHGAVP